MIGFLRGTLADKGDGYIIIDVNGVGYQVFVPANSSAYLNAEGEEVLVYTSMIVREDDVSLFGFSGKGELPYPKLVERMDRAMAALWRGSDLTTLGRENAVGVTQQRNERDLLEEDDAQMISDTLNDQVDRIVLKHLAQTEFPKAYFHLKPSPNKNLNNDLAILKTLYDMGVSLSLNDIREHFGINPPTDKNDTVQK